MVKRLRHRPFTAVTRVRFPLESFYILWCDSQVVRPRTATPLSAGSNPARTSQLLFTKSLGIGGSEAFFFEKIDTLLNVAICLPGVSACIKKLKRVEWGKDDATSVGKGYIL